MSKTIIASATAEPEPSRRQLLAFGAAGAAAAVTCAGAPLLASDSVAGLLPVAADSPVFKAIGFHRNIAAYFDRLASDLGELEDRFFEVAQGPRVEIGYSLVLTTGEREPMFLYSAEEIDRYFNERGGPRCGKPSPAWEERRASVHAEFIEASRVASAEADKVGITQQRRLVQQFNEEEAQALHDLISLPLNSIEECKAVFKYLCEHLDRMGDLDMSDPIHKFLASLGGYELGDEKGDA